MGDIRIKIDARRLEQLDALVPGRADQVVRKVAFEGQAIAQQNAPVDTGNLKNNIEAQPISPRHWKVVAATDYAAAVEFGHIAVNGAFVAAQPYMEPMAQQLVPMFPAFLRAELIK